MSSESINPLIAQMLPSVGEIVPVFSHFTTMPLKMVDDETGETQHFFAIGAANINGIHFDWFTVEQAKFLMTQLPSFIQQATAQTGLIQASTEDMTTVLRQMKSGMRNISGGL
jgi:hypothetical protein